MPNATWPTRLPCYLDQQFTVDGEDGVIRSGPGGPVTKLRPRYSTPPPEQVNGTILVDRDQIQILEDFYLKTLFRVLPFDSREFRLPEGELDDGTTNEATYRFLARPAYRAAAGGRLWHAHLQLEVVSTPLSRALLNVELDPITGERTVRFPAGAITLEPGFNDQLGVSISSTGLSIEYAAQPFDMLDFTLTESYTDVYVNYATGNDTTGTGAIGAPYKTLTKAITSQFASGANTLIHLQDDYIGFLSAAHTGGGMKVNGKVKIIGEGFGGTRTVITSSRENYTKASFAWVDEGGGMWSSTATGPATSANYCAMFDFLNTDEDGYPSPLIAKTSSAEVAATPGSFWHDGTTKLWVHLVDGREPDPVLSGGTWAYCHPTYRGEFRQANSTTGYLLLENIDFVNNTGAAGLHGLRLQSDTVWPNTTKAGLRNVRQFGAAGQGIQIYDAAIFALDECRTKYTRSDGFNYHSFLTTGTKGAYMTGYEHNCVASVVGYDGFANQDPLTDSDNGSSAHDGIHILRTNGTYTNTHGAVVADVSGVHSQNFNLSATRPNHGNDAIPAPQACYWNDRATGVGVNPGMWLWGCYGSVEDADYVFAATGTAGAIKVKHPRGDTSPTLGTVTDYSGNPL